MRNPDLVSEIAKELKAKNCHEIKLYEPDSGMLFFLYGNRRYWGKITKTGHLKKGSIRLD